MRWITQGVPPAAAITQDTAFQDKALGARVFELGFATALQRRLGDQKLQFAVFDAEVTSRRKRQCDCKILAARRSSCPRLRHVVQKYCVPFMGTQSMRFDANDF